MTATHMSEELFKSKLAPIHDESVSVSSDAPMEFADSIAAIATPPGRGGIAIIRISGPDALAVAKRVTSANGAEAAPAAAGDAVDAADAAGASAGAAATGTFKPRQVYFKKIYDGHECIDEGVVIYFKAPHSYTGEDVVEIQGHGGNIVPQRVLSAVLKCPNVRQAEPGEFTRRAFLNGKMDLTAAEAVEDLISAGSESAAKAALASLNGDFASHLNEVQAKLNTFRIKLEACLDFPEDLEDFYDSGKAKLDLGEIDKSIDDALTTAKMGVKLNEGARIVLAGQPNAGKSSLLNALAGAERAIVTNIPGTTRDVLTINIEIGGIPVTITDTAGIRDKPSDEIEAIGIRRALDELKQADLILLMVDSSNPADDALEALSHIQKVFDNPKNLIVLKSKTDLTANPLTAELLKSKPLSDYEQIATSTKSADGLNLLRSKLNEVLGIIPAEGVFSARRRHLTELSECRTHIAKAVEMLDFGDLVLTAREVAIAQEHLGVITGKVTSDDLLGMIFSTFCIGK